MKTPPPLPTPLDIDTEFLLTSDGSIPNDDVIDFATATPGVDRSNNTSKALKRILDVAPAELKLILTPVGTHLQDDDLDGATVQPGVRKDYLMIAQAHKVQQDLKEKVA